MTTHEGALSFGKSEKCGRANLGASFSDPEVHVVQQLVLLLVNVQNDVGVTGVELAVVFAWPFFHLEFLERERMTVFEPVLSIQKNKCHFKFSSQTES